MVVFGELHVAGQVYELIGYIKSLIVKPKSDGQPRNYSLPLIPR